MPTRAYQYKPQRPGPRREPIICPNCGKTYQVESASLGRIGRFVRCDGQCKERWWDFSAIREDGSNPVLDGDFPRKLKLYLNHLPADVKHQSPKSTHAIKSFLIRHGLARDAVGHANGIKVNLTKHRNTEFLWDAVSKVESTINPDDDLDLLFVAESENQPHIDKILEDANKLPIARADVRLMFFRANDPQTLETYFERLLGLFHRHRKTQVDDVYILAGMDMQSLAYRVRKLTMRRPGSNVSPWQEY